MRKAVPQPRASLWLPRYLGNHRFRQLTATGRPVLQRACACGGTCAHCSGHDGEAHIQTKLTVGPPNDRYEQEADHVADQVMRMPEPQVQRQGEGSEGELLQTELLGAQATPLGHQQEAGGGATVPLAARGVHHMPGQPLDATTRAFMEPRFGIDFSTVRVHTGSRAAAAARSVQARAYAVGKHVVFGAGEYAPGSKAGKQLVAHELAHVVQQGAATGLRDALASSVGRRIQRRWDRAASECTGQPSDKWIERIVVRQESPQSVTVHWSDGTQESGRCSAGKGHCCVDPDHPDGVACTQRGSTVNGSNCTPITRRNGYRVEHRDLDHNGVLWWTEFVPSRGIALHEYTPVDGTPLSHGCVRLNHDMAVKIFCGVRQNQTWVQVQGFARPMCDHAALRNEWIRDFNWGDRT